MNAHRLEQVITDLIQEQQIKLGYEKETIRLYFPLESLRRIIGVSVEDDFEKALKEQLHSMEPRFGKIRYSLKEKRYAFSIPPQGSEYVHRMEKKNDFLIEMIELFKQQDVSLQQVSALFFRYDPNFQCKKSDEKEFDYILYFSVPSIDENFYCIKFDEGHSSYHRFSPYDFKELF